MVTNGLLNEFIEECPNSDNSIFIDKNLPMQYIMRISYYKNPINVLWIPE